ncbi:hypothetical protein N9O95_04345, partial [Alphaproteobacteria bacterium]|nr:hypothetical protein [Alphaproteobacteria bacterium]
MLYSAAALGAVAGLIAPELMFAEVVQTFVLPQGYRKNDDGRVILLTQDGQPLYLTEEQFVILEDGLLLVTDELAQNTMQNLLVMGALRANGLLTGTPLASGGGGLIETTTDNPVWTGGRGPIQDFGLGTYQLAQAGVSKVAEETVDTVDTDLLLGSGVSLIALVSGLFGATASSDQTEAEAPTVTGVVISRAESDGSTPKAGTLVAGDKILVTVTVDENITVDTSGGTPQYTIDVGGVSKTAGYVSGSGGTSLVFAYEVQASDFDDAGGITSDTSALDANSGTLQDSDGHDLDLTTIAVSAGANTVGVDAESKFSAIKISGSAAGDRFGRWISTAGDFDGDGVLDVAVSAPALTEAGSSFVLSGAAINSLGKQTYHEIDLSTFSPNQYVQIDGIDAEDHSGHRIVHAGDLNGDGFADIAISAIRAEDSARSQNHGEVYIVWGSSDSFAPTIINLAGLNGTNGVRIIGLNGWSGTGLDLRAAGDVDGDGTPDILIGSEGLGNPSALTESDSYLVYGDALLDTGATFDLSSLDGSNGIRLFGADDGDRSGISVAGGGDVDGDDLSDVLIGAFWAEDATGSTNEGETYLVYGSHLKELRSQQVSSINLGSLGSSEGVRIHGRDEEDGSGHSVDFIGDIDGDGKSEVLVGAHLAEDGDKQTQGESYLVFGSYLNDQVATFDLGSLDGTNGVRLKGANAGDESAYHVASAGDVDNDGKGDFLVGARHADNGTKLDAGITYVVFGDSLLSGNATFDLGSINGTTGVAILGIDAGDHAGISVNSAGDLDGDGFDDALIGVDYANPSGEFYVLSGYSLNQAAEGLGVATSGVIDLAVDFGWGSGSSNSSPTFGSATTSTSVPENTSGAFYTAEATDADSDSLTYSVVGGADGDKFEFNGTGLTFKAEPDYETPADSDSDNVYEVQIQADDGNGGTATQTVSVTVTDVEETGQSTTTITLGEKDDYSASNGNEASPRTTAFETVLSGQTIDAYFDNTQTNSSQGFSFDLSSISGPITGATLKLSAKPLNDSGAEDNDVIRLWGNDPSSGADWATYAATGKTVGLGWDAGPNNYFNFDWRYNRAETIGDPSWDITLDLSNFAAQEGTGLSLVSDIDQNKILNVLVGDDTIVDYAELDLSYSSYEYHDFEIIKILGSQENAGAGVYGMQSGVGDTNSDGFVDIAISEYGVSAGLVHVFFGSDFIGTTNREFGLVAQNSVSISGHLLNDKFGHAVDKMADINGDGAKELIVSSRDADPLGRTDAGSTYVIFDTSALGTASILDDVSLITQLHGASSGDLSGWSVSAISDLNGDDLSELLVGAGFGDPNGTNSGEVYIVSGALVRDRQGSHIDLSQLGNEGLVINGISSSDHLGAYVNAVGDIDGNGTNDLLIAADIADPNGDKSGSA